MAIRTSRNAGMMRSTWRLLCAALVCSVVYGAAACSSNGGAGSEKEPQTASTSSAVVLSSSGATSAHEGGDPVVAENGSWVVTLSEVDQVFRRMALFTPGARTTGSLPEKMMRDPLVQKRAIASVLDGKILREEAKRRDLSASPEEIRKEFGAGTPLGGLLGDVDKRPETLKRYGLTLKDIESVAELKVLVEKLQHAMIGEVSDDELWQAYRKDTEKITLELIEVPNSPSTQAIDAYVKENAKKIEEYWSSHPQKFRAPVSRKVRVLELSVPRGASQERITEVSERLRGLRRDLLAGADFAALATKHSVHPSRQDGGLLGYVVPRQNAHAFSVAVGEITEPVRTKNGWSIYSVEEEVAAHQRPLNAGLKRTIASRILREEKPNAAPMSLAKSLMEAWEKSPEELERVLKGTMLKVHTTLPFRAERGSTAFVPGVGREPAVMDAAAGLTKVGDLVQVPVFARGSLWVLRAKEIPKAKRTLFASQKESFEKEWREREGQRRVAAFLKETKTKSEGRWILGPLEKKYGVLKKGSP